MKFFDIYHIIAFIIGIITTIAIFRVNFKNLSWRIHKLEDTQFVTKSECQMIHESFETRLGRIETKLDKLIDRFINGYSV